MLLTGHSLQLTPFSHSSGDWKHIAKWAYDERYSALFRFHPKAFTQEEFENYPRISGCDVFMISEKKTGKFIGMAQLMGDSKPNRGFFCGILLEETYQNQGHAAEAIALVFDYAFNKLGYRKAIIEVLENNTKLRDIIIKAGFLKEAHLYDEVFYDGEYQDELRYCMMASFFNKKYKGMVQSWRACSVNS